MKARQQFTQLAQSLLSHDVGMAIVDVRGTGDAEGELIDVTWNDWCDDVAAAYASLAKTGVPVFVLGLRLGGLLGLISLKNATFSAAGLVLWEPQFSGKVALKPFLRMGAMSAKLAGREQVNAPGDTREIGGYLLSNAFEQSLNEAVASTDFPAQAGLIVKVSAEENTDLPPAWNAALAPWKEAGVSLTIDHVKFPTFWNTTEIIASDTLTDITQAWIVARLAQ